MRAMTSEVARALSRVAMVMSGYLALATLGLHLGSVTAADHAVVHLLLVLTGGSLLVLAWLLLESRDLRAWERAPEPVRDDWADQ